MTPFRLSGSANIVNVSSGGPRHSWETEENSNSFPTFLNLFTSPNAPIDGSEERASKRRKVESGDNEGLKPVDKFDDNKSVVLAKVSLELSLPALSDDEIGRLHASSGLQDPLVVSFESFATDWRYPHHFRITISSTRVPSTIVDIVATARNDFLNSATSHMKTAASLATTTHGKERPNTRGVSFSRCTLAPPGGSQKFFRLETEIRWTVDVSLVEEQGIKPSRYKEELRMLADYFPDKSRELNGKWSLSDFYDSVHVPSTSLSISPRIQKGMAETLLYPFQQRAVDWLLRREGVSYDDAGLVQPVSDATTPVSFRAAQDATGKQCFVSVLRGLVVSDLSHARDTLQSLRGGILAEEMGLGKTVELIALMCHHKRDIPEGNVYDNYTGTFVKPSSATLIISPPSILEQWINEINTHAPELKVLHYKGLPSATAPKKEHAAATVENLIQYDVVVTTYNVLSKEIYFATPPPDRSLRNEKRHARRKSPLVEISWWRVCLDEAQMVESGVSQAATVARIIPRCNAWAVSGTPLRKNVQDLRGLLIFLRYDSLANNKAIWDRIDKGSFRAIFSQIALRHTKDRIREELRLPPQKRVVITVPFTAIEEQNYSEMIRQMCEACWLSPDGIPLDEDRGSDHPEVIERMRDWLIRLRQTCLHAHVGRKNRRALGARNGALRTVHEVLEVMIEQNDVSLKAAAREMILCQMRCGHVVAYAGNIGNRAESSLPFYKKALEEAESYVKVCREELQAEKEKLNSSSTTQRAVPATEEQDSDSDDEDKQGEILGRIPIVRKTLRSFLALEHAGNFFIGTVYYQIKANEKLTEPDSEDFHRLEKLEVEWYDKAKKIRKEILRESQNRAQRQMKRISSKKPFHQIPEIKDLTDLGGIESRKILDVMDHVTDVLNAQAAQIQTWRSKIVEILLMPLVDEDEGKETTGEEYEDSTKVQDELYIYIMALRTIVADRNAAVNGVQDILVDHELKIAEKSALKKEGHAPDLVLEVVETRRKLLSGGAVGSLKGVVSGIRSVITTLQWKADGGDARASAELAIAQKQLTQIQAITTEQTKIILELEKEQEMFRATMNQRLEFYRQLQHISDTVAPWREELEETLNKAEFVKYSKNGERAQKQLSSLKTKHAYLANLRRENQQEDLKHECIICQDEFEIGVLTTCGHKYCKECINQWWYAHRTCPLCKQKLATSDFKDINFKPSAAKAQEENHETGSSSQASTPGSSSTSIYSDISDATMREIKMIDLDGSYGTKVDMIARHLIWIRNNDPGAKSIIFSQFGDFLEVLREALHRWKIGVSGISDKNGIHKFKTDPAVECFLLDAKSDSSGLNLVNATYVFLCEPLINPAIELQAIARVHRIGQQRPTTVFMYLVSDTVEEAIYDISVSRRLEHMGRTKNTGGSRSGSMTPVLQEKTLDAANSMELEAAPLKQLLRKKGDGEIVQADDLWNCLFGKKRKQHKAVLDREVDRHLRATAAEARRAVGDGS